MMDPNAPQGGQQNNMQNYKFNSDELRVLKECNRASFYERSLPLSGILGAATYYAAKAGHLKMGRYGATPKVCGAIIVGYFIGKVSYQGQCARMLMELPNSPLGEMLRQRTKGSFYGSVAPDAGLGAGLALAPFQSQTDTYSDESAGRRSSLDLDTSRPTFSGLDDTYRPSLDSTPPNYNYDEAQLPLIEPTKPGTTYDDLRKKNREDYLSRAQPPVPPPQSSRPPVVRAAPESPQSPQESAQRNKYGDIWTDTK